MATGRGDGENYVFCYLFFVAAGQCWPIHSSGPGTERGQWPVVGTNTHILFRGTDRLEFIFYIIPGLRILGAMAVLLISWPSTFGETTSRNR
jgi:hypothetical protein